MQNFLPGAPHLESGPQVAEDARSSSGMQKLPDSVFEEISRNLEANLQKKEWANRPRTWYILHQINRLDLMEEFILQGLNDTSIPYRSRQSLPERLDRFEYESFLSWQECVQSDVLQLENGSHVRVDNGDTLFESRRVRLGVGSQGSSLVEEVRSKMTGKVYARKKISKSKRFGHDKQAQKIYENEIKTLRRPELEENEHLIKIKGTYTDKKYLAMLLDPVADKNLKQYMIENALSSEEERLRFRTYFGCLANTIRFLHDREILHKDIKPENVLLKNGHLILTDFGTAFDWSHTNQSMTRSNAEDRRTPRYQSPEVANAGEFHRASDIWSLGVLFLEMTTVLRGKSLAEMDTFTQSHGTCQIHVYENQEGVMKWLEPLRAAHYGSLLDNEALTWVRQMLNHQRHLRPSAERLYEMIVSFSHAQYCGKCCASDEADSEDSDLTSEAGTVTPSDVLEDNRPHSDAQLNPLFQSSPRAAESSEYSELQPFAGRSVQGSTVLQLLPYEIPADSPIQSSSFDRQQLHHTDIKLSKPKTSKSARHRKSLSFRNSNAHGGTVTHSESPGTGQKPLPNKKISVTNKVKSFPGKDAVVQWLFTTAKKFKSPAPARPRRPSRKWKYTVEAQQIGHYLSTLPEELGDYENAHEKLSGNGPFLGHNHIRSRSHENLEPIFESNEIEDDISVPNSSSKVIHFASDTYLPLLPDLSNENREQTFKSLQDFATLTPKLIPRKVFDLQTKNSVVEEPRDIPCGCEDGEERIPNLQQAEQSDAMASQKHSQQSGKPNFQNPLGHTFEEMVGPGIQHLKRRMEQSLVIAHKSSPRLGEWIGGQKLKNRQNRFESATVIMERIMETKTAEAPTSIMSANTQAMFSRGGFMTRYNDEFYGQLPYFVGKGRAGPVRQLLAAGCNPGTIAKPRPSLIFKAVRRASDQHIKCLRALVEYGADVNYKAVDNGRRPIHYAIEQATWSGYSSVIFVLLKAGADPNVRDKIGDLPLLMLLTGNGPLPQERRDALLLLLAPNFTTSLNVKVPGTMDNPLHLIVRRKDACAVDAILEKMKRDGETTKKLLQGRNGAGFSPLLLAFSVFAFIEDVSEELRIVKLLLENHANPDDKDAAKGDTCLHRVVIEFKNAIALELLCRHKADPHVSNMAGQTPFDIVNKSLEREPNDSWNLFAKRRLTNNLKENDYRPRELVEWLSDEDNAPP